MFPSSFTLCNTSLVTRSAELVFSNLLQHHIPKLPRYLWSTFLMSRFQHHRKQCPKCIILLVSFLNVGQICWWNNFFVEFCFYYGNPEFNFLCRSYIICYQATEIFEIFHIRFVRKHQSYHWRIENLDVITKRTLCTVAALTFSNLFLQFSSAISTWTSLIFLTDGPKFHHYSTQHPVITILGTAANFTLQAVRSKSTEQSSLRHLPNVVLYCCLRSSVVLHKALDWFVPADVRHCIKYHYVPYNVLAVG